jgi:hypothetical protein
VAIDADIRTFGGAGMLRRRWLSPAIFIGGPVWTRLTIFAKTDPLQPAGSIGGNSRRDLVAVTRSA